MGNERKVESNWGVLAWAVAAVGAGTAVLAAIGAPSRMMLVNGAALLIGLAGVGLIGMCRRAGVTRRVGDVALLGASALLPLTAFVGPETSGVARWLVVGGLTIQPSMIVVPLLALGVAMRPSLARTAAVIVAAVGLALQPDPGGAAMLLLGLVMPLLLSERGRLIDLIGALAAAIGFAVAQTRTVALPPVPFVEQVVQDALRSGPLAALLALAAALLMLVPGVARPMRAPQLAFVGVWVAAVAMTLLGPYPTPVFGFGGSGVLGFVLGAGLLALETPALRRR